MGAVVILIFYVGHKLYTRNWKLCVKLEDIDLDSGRRSFDLDLIRAEIEEEKPPIKLNHCTNGYGIIGVKQTIL